MTKLTIKKFQSARWITLLDIQRPLFFLKLLFLIDLNNKKTIIIPSIDCQAKYNHSETKTSEDLLHLSQRHKTHNYI